MNALSKVWQRLRSKAYREAFVASQLKRGIPTQIRVLLKDRNWTQSDLAQRAGLKQGVVSRAADPDYGNLTINTILKIAAGFDVAYVGRFVPFSELARWYTDLSESALSVPSFDDEVGAPKGSVAPDAREKDELANMSVRLMPVAAGLDSIISMRYANSIDAGLRPDRKPVASAVVGQRSEATSASIGPVLSQLSGR